MLFTTEVDTLPLITSISHNSVLYFVLFFRLVRETSLSFVKLLKCLKGLMGNYTSRLSGSTELLIL